MPTDQDIEAGARRMYEAVSPGPHSSLSGLLRALEIVRAALLKAPSDSELDAKRRLGVWLAAAPGRSGFVNAFSRPTILLVGLTEHGDTASLDTKSDPPWRGTGKDLPSAIDAALAAVKWTK